MNEALQLSKLRYLKMLALIMEYTLANPVQSEDVCREDWHIVDRNSCDSINEVCRCGELSIR